MPTIGWVVLALIWTRAWWGMRIHWVTIRNLMMLPLLFIGFGIAGIYGGSQAQGLGWGAAAAMMFVVGFLTAPRPIAVDRRAGRLQLPASIVAPLRYFLIFAVRMELLISLQMHPEQRAVLFLATSIFAGAVAGYYVGWCAGLLDHYRRAPAGSGFGVA